MKNPDEINVAVIGAGLSGLTAALRLVQAGEDSVVVFEARERVGGRTLNQPIPGDQFVENGGQWVGPTQHRVLALAEEMGMRTFRTFDRGRNVMVLGGKRHVYRGPFPLSALGASADFVRGAAKLQVAAWRVDRKKPWTSANAQALDAMTFDDWLRRNIKTPEARALFEVISGLTLGGDPADLSLLWVLQHLRSAGGLLQLITVRGGAQDRRFVGGSQELSLRIAKKLNGHVRTESPVERIEWDQNSARIHTRGGVVVAKKVIIAMSPPDRQRIRFEPALPAAQVELGRRMTMFKGIKAHIVYDKPFWRDDGLSGQALSDCGPAPITFDNSHPESPRGVLVAFMAGKASHSCLAPSERELANPQARREGLIECLVRYFGEKARAPIDYIEKDWRDDVYSAGCIPTMPPGVLTELGPQIDETTESMIWSGTETSHIWGGYMDGAVRSGEHAARITTGLYA